MDISIVVGNPNPKSRTMNVAERVAAEVAATLAPATTTSITRTVDLCEYSRDLFTWPQEALAAVCDAVAASDVVVVASPTYKAAYTGLLKAFLDRYPTNGLAGVTAVPVMTGGSAHHAMAVDTSLRPLLVELGASVPWRGLYFETSHMDELSAIVQAWGEANLIPPRPSR